ncbi:MAG: hypothetical protein AAF206_09690 [Bacteroidota bacterium]
MLNKPSQIFLFLILASLNVWGQEEGHSEKRRLDFAKTYFEYGGSFFPSFTGKRLINDEIQSFEHSASIGQYLNWGGFHFWGHAEFYATFPLGQNNLRQSEAVDFQLRHSVSTGARILPWAYEPLKLRPYVGVSWSALDFQQIVQPETEQPVMGKDVLLVPDIGVLYGYKQFALRLGVHYFHNNQWNYPLSRTRFADIETPKWMVQLGLNYSFENSHVKDEIANERWNTYPRIASPGFGTKRRGDFFIGLGPSSSFSTKGTAYNATYFPWLRDKLISTFFADAAIGYHFYQPGILTALSFRNPRFVNEGYGMVQSIHKNSLALEVSKLLTDYSGFAPYVGVNLAYDRFSYSETDDGHEMTQTFDQLEPGFTFGWDIIPGKTDEALILRTNLRWYPWSDFEIEGKAFSFAQLEYNLIQVIFYPGRWKRSRG